MELAAAVEGLVALAAVNSCIYSPRKMQRVQDDNYKSTCPDYVDDFLELDEESVVGDEDRSLSDPIDYAIFDANTPSLFSMDENAVGDADDVEIENRPYELVDQPEAEKKRRRQYSIKERLYLINEIEELHKSTSLRKACKQFSITHSIYWRWTKNETSIVS